MSNLINSTNININNEIAAKKLHFGNKESFFVEAPQSLPKYSIDKVLQEKDDFRKQIILQQNETWNKQNKRRILPKIGIILAAAAGFFILKKKK